MALNSIILLAEESTESLGNVMAQAGLNTLMGISIVFLALVFISIVIALFGNIGKAQNKKEAGKKEKALAEATPKVEVTEDLSSDEELVAVITAAIYAFESEQGGYVPEDGLVVRSIRRINKLRK